MRNVIISIEVEMMNINEIVNNQREFYKTNQTKNIKYRKSPK